MDCQTKADIKALYGAILFVKEYLKNDIQRLKDCLKNMKSELHMKNKRLIKEYEDFRLFNAFVRYREDGESKVVFLKTDFIDDQEAEDWCNDYYEGNQICSPYDCTGQWFCSSIRWAHMKNNIWLIKIRMNRDV